MLVCRRVRLFVRDESEWRFHGQIKQRSCPPDQVQGHFCCGSSNFDVTKQCAFDSSKDDIYVVDISMSQVGIDQEEISYFCSVAIA